MKEDIIKTTDMAVDMTFEVSAADIKSMNKLPREFYLDDTKIVAKALLGKILVHETKEGITAGRIAETEAYLGINDPASHAFGDRRTARTEPMYGIGGHAYVYLIYGMYNCMNVVTGDENDPQAVLIRALEPLVGIDIMKKRRNTEKITALCSGPGKLCKALAIARENDGADLCEGRLYILHEGKNEGIPADGAKMSGPRVKKEKSFEIEVSGRIGIDYSGDAKNWPLRFMIKGSSHISVKPKSRK